MSKKSWHISTISHKYHACCHGLHATLEALSGAQVDPERLASIRIRTHPRWMSVCNIADPKTGLEAKFSYAQVAAMAILGHATGRIENFNDAMTRDPQVRALRDIVEVMEDESLTETQAQVTLTLKSGEVRRLRHDLMAPITLEARSLKLRAKVDALLSEDRAAPLWQAVIGQDLEAVTATF
ncbi:MmgE/PrpD family protein [Sulfitobacter albidus]|uniref:MmgE/PrpD family protein n=1 Tax=Sulfitobacter albidus TaxID=2829501 RepID=UPI0020C8E9BC|nr:MmgE/PrpD family protein [Sulfitobacter albidus]